MTRDPQLAFTVGSLVQDARRRTIGIVMGHVGPNYQLRPPGGGREWDVDPRDIRPLPSASAAEALSAHGRAANRQIAQDHRGREGWV